MIECALALRSCCVVQFAALELRVAELQRQLETLRIEYDRQLAALMAELQAAKIEIDRLLSEMRRLFDQKIALELEITQYKKLLAMEDARRGVKEATIITKKEEKTEREKRSQYARTKYTHSLFDSNVNMNAIDLNVLPCDVCCAAAR